MLGDFFSIFLLKGNLSLIRCVLDLRTATNGLCSPYNFTDRSTLKENLC